MSNIDSAGWNAVLGGRGWNLPYMRILQSTDYNVNMTVICWGDNSSGQTSAPAGQFADISAGGDHTCVLTADTQTVKCWGGGLYHESSPPPDL